MLGMGLRPGKAMHQRVLHLNLCHGLLFQLVQGVLYSRIAVGQHEAAEIRHRHRGSYLIRDGLISQAAKQIKVRLSETQKLLRTSENQKSISRCGKRWEESIISYGIISYHISYIIYHISYIIYHISYIYHIITSYQIISYHIMHHNFIMTQQMKNYKWLTTTTTVCCMRHAAWSKTQCAKLKTKTIRYWKWYSCQLPTVTVTCSPGS